MIDAPNRIWFANAKQAGTVAAWGGTAPHGCIEYRRADLPPTLAEALDVPDVRALVGLMPEVLASLDATGCNVSLAKDVRKALGWPLTAPDKTRTS